MNNLLMSQINQMKMGLGFLVENHIIDFSNKMISNVGNNLGKQFVFDKNDTYIIDTVTNNFLKKYDKKFDSHTSVIDRQNKYLDSQILIPLHKEGLTTDTYIYLTTGKYSNIGNMMGKGDNYGRSGSSINEDIGFMKIFIFGKKSKKFIKELTTIIDNAINKNELGIYNVSVTKNGDISSIYNNLPIRDFDSLYFSNGEIEKITKFIDKFNSMKEFYLKKQLLYKTGILLYGKPGTGKTSLVKAIANYTNRSIININISDFAKLNVEYITQSINVDPYKYIVLFEDIDTLFLNREELETDKEEMGVVNKLLQFLDSNSSPQDVIFIATTNHLDRLDDALLRDGRFDIQVEIDEILEPQVYDFGRDFGVSDSDIKDVLDEYATRPKFDGSRYNQSAIQNYMLNKIDNKARSTDIIDTAEVIAEEMKKESSEEEDELY